MKHIAARFHQLSVAISIFAMLIFPPNFFGSTDTVVPPGRAAAPISATLGPDNNVWFTEQSGMKIGRITAAGVITEFPVSGAQALTGIASGSDGNIWFTDELAGTIGRISTSGTGLTIFPLPAVNSHPQGIAAGPDGNMWFVDEIQSGSLIGGGFKVGKITPGGNVMEYSTNVNAGTFSPQSYSPSQITKGSDGNLWFTNSQAGAYQSVVQVADFLHSRQRSRVRDFATCLIADAEIRRLRHRC